ncbi:LEUNIG-like protein [Raphanus sativus]|nr:LEUNIG-like protein [Raphanus sativus]
MALLKSGANHHGYKFWQLACISCRQTSNGPRKPSRRCSVSAASQKLQSRSQQIPEIKSEVDLGESPRQLPVDPSTVYGQFSFSEVSSIRRSASKVVCCSFSSDGKLLASAGRDKKKTEILCSCDGNNDILFWNTNDSNYIRASKGASTQVRFQPISGHSSNVNSVCWNTSRRLHPRAQF